MADPQEYLLREEFLTRQFYEWEIRGRGWHVFNEPVQLEPVFRRFWHHYVPRTGQADDARKPTILSAFFDSFRKGRVPCRKGHEDAEDDREPAPAFDTVSEELTEFQIVVPASQKISADFAELFLYSLDACLGHIAFEIIGSSRNIIVQVACRISDAPQLRSQISAYFPEVVVRDTSQSLVGLWGMEDANTAAVLDFGLSREFMLPLSLPRTFDPDPFISLVGALSDLEEAEVGVFQVLFEPLRNPWVPSIMRAVTDNEGQCFFDDAPEFLRLAREKVSKPLFATVVRVATQARSEDRAVSILRNLAGTFAQFSHGTGNEIVALDPGEYPFEEHLTDVFLRRSRRSGMILNSEELAALAHLPSSSVRTAKLLRQTQRTKKAPTTAGRAGVLIGHNVHAGNAIEVRLSTEQRLRHMHVIGTSGTGKSTLLENLILQDIGNGEGVGVLDPHGDLIDEILGRIPEHRMDDVVFIDPADEAHPVGFNILSVHSELEKTLLASDIVAVFQRLSTSWGDQMTSVLGNAVLAILESSRGGTLVDLRRFLVEKDFREEFLKTATDDEVVYYWQKEFPLLAGRPQASVLTRLDTFLRPKLIRHMVAQQQNRLDFSAMMNERKIFLAKLAQGTIGEENSYLLGSLFVAKFHQMAMGRQNQNADRRTPFFLYIDEFHNFMTPSMASILSGARKYGLGLILAHQEFRQLWSRDTEVASAVLSNPYTRVCFRLGDFDSDKLQDGFSYFDAKDLQNLGVGEAIVRLERAEHDFNINTAPLPAIDSETAQSKRRSLVEYSRAKYGSARSATAGALIDGRPESSISRDVESTLSKTKATPATSEMLSDKTQSAPSEQPHRATQVRPRTRTTTPGRGGTQHKRLQHLIKRLAEDRGYRATIEEPVLGGAGSVDVALKKGDQKIACEICISTSAEHEIRNMQKCFAAGFDQVVVIAADKRNLAVLKERITPECDAGTITNVLFFLPGDLITYLDQANAVAQDVEQIVKGYKVKLKYKAVPDEERQTVQQAISRVLLNAVRKSKR